MTAERLRVGEVAEIRRGTVPARTVASGSGPHFFGIKEISSAGGSVRYPEPGTDLSKAVYLQEGDVVVALMGRLGESAMLKEEHVGAVLGRECAVLRLKPGESRVAGSWLHAWTQSNGFRDLAERSASGTTMPRLPTRTLEEFEVPMASPAKQQEMAELLDRFDHAVRATHHSLELLEQLRVIEIDLALASPDVPSGAQGSKAPRAQQRPRKVKRLRRQ